MFEPRRAQLIRKHFRRADGARAAPDARVPRDQQDPPRLHDAQELGRALAPLRDIRAEDTPEPVPADADGRSAQSFLVEAVVTRGNETRRAVAGGRDIYAVTAPLVVEALARMLQGDRVVTGVVAVGVIFSLVMR